MASRFTAKEQLRNLADAMVEDIMALTDDEVMAEALEEFGSQEAVDAEVARIKQLFERPTPQLKEGEG